MPSSWVTTFQGLWWTFLSKLGWNRPKTKKYQISPLARPTICQNLKSCGPQTTEIPDFQSPKNGVVRHESKKTLSFSDSSVEKPGKMVCKKNWLLRACIANIKEIQQYTKSPRNCYQNQQSIQGFTYPTKDRHKVCDHNFEVPKIIIKTNKVFRALLSTQKTTTKCVITPAGKTG